MLAEFAPNSTKLAECGPSVSRIGKASSKTSVSKRGGRFGQRGGRRYFFQADLEGLEPVGGTRFGKDLRAARAPDFKLGEIPRSTFNRGMQSQRDPQTSQEQHIHAFVVLCGGRQINLGVFESFRKGVRGMLHGARAWPVRDMERGSFRATARVYGR